MTSLPDLLSLYRSHARAMRHRVSGVRMSMVRSRWLVLVTLSFFLMTAGGCLDHSRSGRTPTKTIARSESAVLTYRYIENDLVLLDSIELPPSILERFVRAWNNADGPELRKYAARYSINVRFTDGHRRTFRLNGSHAKESNDWSWVLKDTLLTSTLDSLRDIHQRWFGRYETESGALLNLFRNGRYHYFLSQCTYGWSSEGTWSTNEDTLRLSAAPEPKRAEGPLADRFEWASFEEPFVRKGRLLYFTVEGELNYHYFFTME